MQRRCATDDEIADCGLQIEKQNVVLTIRNPQSPIRNFRGDAQSFKSPPRNTGWPARDM